MSGATSEVRIEAPRGELPVYVAASDGDASAPAVIVIQGSHRLVLRPPSPGTATRQARD